MICKEASSSIHLMILRPYSLSAESSLANDRYLNIAEASLSIGVRVTLLAQAFSHSKLLARSPEDLRNILRLYPFASFVSVPSYKKSTGFRRLCAELVYAFKAFILLVRIKPSHVLVGEPLFFVGWIALFYGFLYSKSISSDLIDAWPEALSIPKRQPLEFTTPIKILFLPLLVSRAIRLKLYKKIFTVSKSYISLIPGSDRSRASIFYWCSKTFSCAYSAHESRKFKTAEFGPGSPFVISYAGSLGSGYDIRTIIKAAILLDQRFPGCFVFSIAGGGHKSTLLLQSSAKNLSFFGYLSSLEASKMLSSSHLMLLPYSPNSAVAMPIKFFDAVNLCLPVVSSLGLECKDLIVSNRLGSCYQAESPESLATSIIEVRENHDVYCRNMSRFSSYCSRLYSPSETYKELVIELVS